MSLSPMQLLAIIAIIIILKWIYGRYTGSFNFGYQMYRAAYKEFKSCQSYYQFANFFKDKNEGKGTNDNEKAILKSLLRLIEEKPELVKEYFNKEQFRYKVEYNKLVNTWNQYEPKSKKRESALDFRDLLNLDPGKQTELIDKIKKHLTSDTIRGKKCAHLIQALRNNNLITITNISHLITEMTNFFDYDFGSYSGINDYLSGNNNKTMDNSEIEKLEKNLKST